MRNRSTKSHRRHYTWADALWVQSVSEPRVSPDRRWVPTCRPSGPGVRSKRCK